MDLRNWLLALTGAVALAWTAGMASPMTDDASDVTPPTGGTFVDNDGDGINDMAQVRHGLRSRSLVHAYREQQRQMVADLRSQLTDAQKAELDALVAQMREGDASREDIRAAIGNKFVEFGLTLPENWNESFDQFKEQHTLTDAQKTEIKTLIETMRAEGKTREEIRAAVEAKYVEWGKTLLPGGPGRFERENEDHITAAQRTEIRTLVQSMRDAGNTPAEIRAAVTAKLDEWGVEMTGRREGWHGGWRNRGRNNGGRNGHEGN